MIEVFLPLLLVIALVWVLKNAVEDVTHAAKGRPSPRREFWDKRWTAREKRTGKPRPTATGWWSRGPMRRYLFDSWADAWSNANTKRADRVADERAAYEAARVEQIAARDAALAAAAQQRQQTHPTPNPGAGPAEATPAPAATATAVKDPASIPTPTPEELADMFARPSMPNPASPTGPAASTSKEDAPMAVSNAPEVSGHGSAKNYADAMAKAAAAAVTSLEQTIASMKTGKVGGPAIGHLGRAQEAATQMAAELRAAHGVLSRHDGVTEAYQANQDAGDKDWMTKE